MGMQMGKYRSILELGTRRLHQAGPAIGMQLALAGCRFHIGATKRGRSILAQRKVFVIEPPAVRKLIDEIRFVLRPAMSGHIVLVWRLIPVSNSE